MRSPLHIKFVITRFASLKHSRLQAMEQGFTMVELLVVIVIIGLLSALALPSFLNQANKARQAEAKTYVGAINRAQQGHFLQHNEFGVLPDLELSISSSANYVYTSLPSGSGITAMVDTTATPNGVMRGYTGRVWIRVMLDGNATSDSILCEGDFGTIPTITGTTCP